MFILYSFVLSYIIILAFIMFLLICGNNNRYRNGLIGKIYHDLTIRIPNYLSRLIEHNFVNRYPIFCKISYAILNNISKYMIFGFYICIYLFFSLTFQISCYNEYSKVFFRPNFARIGSIVVLPLPWVLFVIFQLYDPGVINKENIGKYLQRYPYDNIIYKHTICRTTKLPVIPRSRYCQYWNRRIAKYDHYCHWVMAPIGERTHRFFLLFLVFNLVSSLTYFALTYRFIMFKLISFKSLMILVYYEPYAIISCVSLFVTSIVLILYIIQQIYYISINISQIEIPKYKAQKEINNIYDKGFVLNWKEFLFPDNLSW